MKAKLLFELGCEELPPKALKSLAQALCQSLNQFLLENDFIEAGNDSAKWFATPRRLAVSVDDVLAQQPVQQIERRGPSVKAAFDAGGNPTKASEGFAKSVGVTVDKLETLKTEQGEWLYYRAEQPGKNLSEVIEEGLQQAVKKLPIPKRMRWADADAEFVRPVHWLVCLHGDKVLPVSLFNIQSGRASKGHRFHISREVLIPSASDYETALDENGMVVADYDKRKSAIEAGIAGLIKDKSLQVYENAALLDEVTSLVELPRAVMGSFDDKFLELPKEVLISSMQDHQKYFCLENVKDGKLAPHFITISNIESKNEEQVKKGNERVLRARLSDAEFFWQQDQKVKLHKHADKLSSVLFHHKLGSMQSKVARLVKLATYIAEKMQSDVRSAVEAAKLCKADLVTGMVGEFPELQGTMGRYYAAAEGMDQDVAEAIEQHYLPKHAGDTLPAGATSVVLALADKLDTICGIFLADEIPTGDKDPFALRRQSLGILRILIEKQCPFSIEELVSKAVHGYHGNGFEMSSEDKNTQQKIAGITQFIKERLKNYYQSQGIPTHVYLSVAEVNPVSPLDFDARVKAVDSFRKSDSAESLAAANKRIRNILASAKADENENQSALIDKTLLNEVEEKALVAAIENIEAEVAQAMEKADYVHVLETLSKLKDPVDTFFDHVIVMAEIPRVQKNRLAILLELRRLFTGVADISLLSQAKQN